jgi:hypothetical protein
MHARGMDHMLCGERAAAGNCGRANSDRTDTVAFILDRGSAFAPNRAGHATTQN